MKSTYSLSWKNCLAELVDFFYNPAPQTLHRVPLYIPANLPIRAILPTILQCSRYRMNSQSRSRTSILILSDMQNRSSSQPRQIRTNTTTKQPRNAAFFYTHNQGVHHHRHLPQTPERPGSHGCQIFTSTPV